MKLHYISSLLLIYCMSLTSMDSEKVYILQGMTPKQRQFILVSKLMKLPESNPGKNYIENNYKRFIAKKLAYEAYTLRVRSLKLKSRSNNAE